MGERDRRNNAYEERIARDPILRFLKNNRKKFAAIGAVGVTLVIAGIKTDAEEVWRIGCPLVAFSYVALAYSYLSGNVEESFYDAGNLIASTFNKISKKRNE